LDNTVIIWNLVTGKLVHTLEGNNGFIKGVAWDPTGKYLASQAEQSVTIWRVEHGTQETLITEPYNSPLANSNSFFYRLESVEFIFISQEENSNFQQIIDACVLSC
jgi:protein HIRA/HIR1